MSADVLFSKYILAISVRPIIATSAGPDVHKICWIGTTLTVDERAEVVFRSLEGRCRGN